jgi:hypothetical protein
MAARSKVGSVFARSNAVIMGSNVTQGMNVCSMRRDGWMDGWLDGSMEGRMGGLMGG